MMSFVQEDILAVARHYCPTASLTQPWRLSKIPLEDSGCREMDKNSERESREREPNKSEIDPPREQGRGKRWCAVDLTKAAEKYVYQGQKRMEGEDAHHT